MTRHQSRELAVKIAFNMAFQKDLSVDDLFENIQISTDVIPDEYAKKIITTIKDNIDDIDTIIGKHSLRWKSNRLPIATLSILRVALAEILYLKEPVGAIINEAVVISKVYCGDEDPAYINGVLGGLATSLENEN